MTYHKMFLPGSVIGIIGGGQLGRMLAFSAQKMGYEVGVLDPQADCPAGQVANWQIQGEYDDDEALALLAERCDVLTYEFENVASQALEVVAQKVSLPQGIKLLEVSQNRQSEKAFLTRHHLPVVNYRLVQTLADCEKALQVIGYPAVLKTVEGGYDGHGQLVIQAGLPIPDILELLSLAPCILEEWFPFEKEVSIMVTRNRIGEITLLPVAENHHINNILHKSVVPARISEQVRKEIEAIGIKLAEALQLQGILGIEFFLGRNQEIVINEIAPRPHNSGHFSMEACDFSQFDLHILGICNRPLPKVSLLSSVVMVNLLGQHLAKAEEILKLFPSDHCHYYGKSGQKKNRKMGHLTILTDDIDTTEEKIRETSIW